MRDLKQAYPQGSATKQPPYVRPSSARIVRYDIPSAYGGNHGSRQAAQLSLNIELVCFDTKCSRPIMTAIASVAPLSIFWMGHLVEKGNCILTPLDQRHVVEIPKHLVRGLVQGHAQTALETEKLRSTTEAKNRGNAFLCEVLLGCAENEVGERRFLRTRVIAVKTQHPFQKGYLSLADQLALCDLNFENGEPMVKPSTTNHQPLLNLQSALDLFGASGEN